MKEFIILTVVFVLVNVAIILIDEIRGNIFIGRCDTNIKICNRHIRTHKGHLADIEFDLETSDIPDEFK